MSRRRVIVLATVVAALATLAGVQLGHGQGNANAAAPAACRLGTDATGQIKHVIYLQFDNTHFRRDNPNVASDLEQMPHLLNFLKRQGTLFTNDHTILISHTAGGILSSLTGLYPDRSGQTVTNSYGYFPASKNPAFTSAFKYWTAPWVPFTRAGCDVGGVGTANIELENNGTSPTGDITKVFGQGSPEWTETVANPQQGQTDFVGIAIHCSQSGRSICAGAQGAKPDLLPDEPGGYLGFNALFGSKYVDPAVAKGQACVKDTNGDAITDPDGYCGFPGFDGMLAKNTLGYVAAMQEAGVQVTYGYISDAHDLHAPIASTDSYSSSATGPGELGHMQQLKQYDDAFQAFFDELDRHGINRDNTLFVITVDEGDHFAGGVGVPQQGQSWLLYNHTTCTNLATCPTNQIGEIGTNIHALLPSGEPAFSVHSDDAPTVYVNGQPARTDPAVRKLERDVGGLQSLDPYVRDSSGQVQTVPLTVSLADPVEEKTLHMINADPSRTPTFTLFGHDDFFFQDSNPCSGLAQCVTTGFAWNHGDVQEEIGNTWVGFVGPGIQRNGIDDKTWTDHTNLRPTILSLTGLKDDYTDDGRVLVEGLRNNAVPNTLRDSTVQNLMAAYEQVNASFGDFANATLAASTRALEGDDATYTSLENQIADLTAQRDALVSQIKTALDNATFSGTPITPAQAQSWTDQANQLIQQAKALAP